MVMKKIAIIGTGQVGQAIAHQLARENFCNDIILLGRKKNMAQGIALDIQHAIPLFESNSIISGDSDYSTIAGSSIVVITAGVSRKPGMSRLDLLDSNRVIVKEVVQNVMKYAPDAYLIIVTNPVDILTYHAWKMTGWSRNRVIGLSCILDSARMVSLIGKKTGFSVREISALVIGGHGDAMVPLPRFSRINGIPIDIFLSQAEIDDIIKQTRLAGGDIVALKGMSGFIAAAAAVVTMLDAIINDRNHILPCVAVLEGEYGYDRIALGVPTVLGGEGVTNIIELPLNDGEQKLLLQSADEIKEKIEQLNTLK
jgi:malate dehydrogenase